MKDEVKIGPGICIVCKLKKIVNRTGMCLACHVGTKQAKDSAEKKQVWDALSISCPWNEAGDCTGMVSTVYPYNEETGKQDILYNSCEMALCPVWHFVSIITLVGGK